MATYTYHVKSLRCKQNANIQKIIYLIAEANQFIYKGNVMYKLLFYYVLKPHIDGYLQEKGHNFRISHRQYKNMRKMQKGKVSLKLAYFLLAIYDYIQQNPSAYQDKLLPGEENITYQHYLLCEIVKAIKSVLDNNRQQSCKKLTPKYEQEFMGLLKSFDEMDEDIDEYQYKIYNNIW